MQMIKVFSNQSQSSTWSIASQASPGLYKVPPKKPKIVLEIVEQGAKFFAKLFKIKKDSIHIYTDGGSEFERLKDKFHHITVLVGPKVEQKNSHLQRNFHRIKNSKRGNTIKNVLQQALNTTNNSYKPNPEENTRRSR